MTSFLMLAALAASAPGARAGTTGTVEKYIVLYRHSAVPADTASTIRKAGGALVAAYPQIGVAIAKSSSTTFRGNLLSDSRIQGAVATTKFASRIDDGQTVQDETTGKAKASGELPNTPVTDTDTLSGLQWDMRQIHAPEAHEITGGSADVIVGDLDTGLDKDHPDLVANIDFSRSVSCESGAPNTDPAAWDDHFGHGTHTAGTIAAAANGFGIVGVAPNVKIAGIKSSNDDGFFFPEMVVCSFVWAGTHQIDVTNNSYFADPWLYNCRNDPDQRAIWLAEQRAIRFAMSRGVTVVASEGNASEDLSHPTKDLTSPDFPEGSAVEREITNACLVVPVEIPGVLGVTANGNTRQVDGDSDPDDFLKSFYSNYGISTADVVAPGGDSRYGITAEATNGRVLSTYPAELPCARPVTDPTGATYCYLQGTSMAGPHAVGVAALAVSTFGHMAPGKVGALVEGTADSQPCPTELPSTSPVTGQPYSSVLGDNSGLPQVCEGGPTQNSWYGSGQVNALRAITHDTG